MMTGAHVIASELLMGIERGYQGYSEGFRGIQCDPKGRSKNAVPGNGSKTSLVREFLSRQNENNMETEPVL